MKLVVKDNSSYRADRLVLYPFDPLFLAEDGKIYGRNNIVVPVGDHEIVIRYEHGEDCEWCHEWATIIVDGVIYGKPVDDADLRRLVREVA